MNKLNILILYIFVLILLCSPAFAGRAEGVRKFPDAKKSSVASIKKEGLPEKNLSHLKEGIGWSLDSRSQFGLSFDRRLQVGLRFNF